MASSKRQSDLDLRARLAREGNRFGFFEAVDLATRLSPDRAPVGELGPAAHEAVRFKHDPSLGFHASDVTSIGASDGVTTITSTFLGLFGTVSPLPAGMSEEVLHADGAEDAGLQAFYDLFNHRVLSLFYRAWAKHRLGVQHRADGNDALTRRMLAFVGVDARGAQPAEGMAPHALLALAPLVARRDRSARALRAAVETLLGVPIVAIEPFALRRTALRPEQRVTLGVRNSTLGRDLAVGQAVRDRVGRFRLILGPFDRATFDALSPGGALFPRLRAIVAHFADAVLETEIELQLRPEDAPRLKLGGGSNARLGRTSRIGRGAAAVTRARMLLGGDPADATPRLVDGTAS